MLTPEQQAAFVDELPAVFVPVAGGWGRMGATHIVLAKAVEDVLQGALLTAWRLRVEMNQRSRTRPAKAAGSPTKGAGKTKAIGKTKASATRPRGARRR